MRRLLERVAGEEGLSSEDLQSILDALPVPLSWASLSDGAILFVNRAFKALFGYVEDTFPTVDAWIDTAYVNDGQRCEARRRWKELWTSRSTGVGEVDQIELDVLCRDGSIRTVQHRGILLRDIGIGIATFNDISDRKRAEDALFRLGYEDPLTGLPNRRLLQERWLTQIARPVALDRPSAVLLIDLDGFKDVNDNLGHDAGDAVLRAVSDRLTASVRDGDLVCRLGGDEFVIILRDIVTFERVGQLCWCIDAALRQPVTAGRQAVTVGASIGASLFPQDGTDLQSLLKRADEALYRVKKTRKGGWDWFMAPAAA